MIPDALTLWVCDDKIFVDESPKGFFIEVFDSEGNKLYHIEKSYQKFKVTEEHQKDILERFKSDRLVKIQGWERIKRSYQKFHYPEYFPAIQNLVVVDKKIYVQNLKKKHDSKEEEFIIMDLKGNTLKILSLPVTQKPHLYFRMTGLGPKFFTIAHDKCYYLVENEDEEEWELHVTDIK